MGGSILASSGIVTGGGSGRPYRIVARDFGIRTACRYGTHRHYQDEEGGFLHGMYRDCPAKVLGDVTARFAADHGVAPPG